MGFNIDNPSRLLQPWRNVREFSEQMYAMMQSQQTQAQLAEQVNRTVIVPALTPNSQAQTELRASGVPQYTPPTRRPIAATSGNPVSVAQSRRTEAATQAASISSQIDEPTRTPYVQPAAGPSSHLSSFTPPKQDQPAFDTGSHTQTFTPPTGTGAEFNAALHSQDDRVQSPIIAAAEAAGAKTPYTIAPPVATLPPPGLVLGAGLNPVSQFIPPAVGFVSGSLLNPSVCYVQPFNSFTSGDLLPPAVCKRPPTPALLIPDKFDPILTDPWEMIESQWKGALPEKNDGIDPPLGGGVADPALVGFVSADIGPNSPASPDGWLMGNVDLYDNGPPGKTAGDNPSSTVPVIFEGVLHTDVIPSGTWIFNIQLYEAANLDGSTADVYYAGIPYWLP